MQPRSLSLVLSRVLVGGVVAVAAMGQSKEPAVTDAPAWQPFRWSRPDAVVPAAKPVAWWSQAGARDPDRPRIGLVLSGGGARGAAHIGVIDLLEELQVPVDFVVGTSMGAIVGGLYSTGYAPDEMARIIEEADWGTLLSDAPPRDELWFRRRQDNRVFQVDFELAWVDGGLVLPPGLILGRNIEAFLEHLTLPVAGLEQFDSMRLPFRCVATDLADGSAVVFESGNLARAIRASMSLPGVFSPVIHDGQVLVDGGVVDNIPVDVARDLGADILIVVDISTPLEEVSHLNSPLGVSNQVVSILMAGNRTRAMELLTPEDIAIVPELGDLAVMDFGRAVEAIELGRKAASMAREDLAALGVDDAAWTRYLARQRMPHLEPRTIRNLIIDRRTRFSERVIRRIAALREGDKLDPAKLEEARESLAGLGVFEGIEVDVHPVEGSEDEVDVVLRPIEKAWGPDYLRFGLGISSDLKGEGDFDFGVQHTSTPLNSLGGEWRNEVQIGTRTRIFTEFYQPLDSGLRWFVAPYLGFEQDNVALIVDRQKIAEVNIEAASAGLAVGRNLGAWGEVRTSIERNKGTARPAISLPGLIPDRVDVETTTAAAALTVDTLDSIAFPRHGVVGQLEYELTDNAIATEERRGLLSGTFGVPLTRGAFTVFASMEGGSRVDGEESVGADFTLGGFRRLSGLGPGEIAGNHYALGVLQSYYQLSERDSLFGLGRYLGASLEYGGFWEDRDDPGSDDFLVGGSVYLGFDSLLGPAFLGVGLTEGGERSLYVFIGPFF